MEKVDRTKDVVAYNPYTGQYEAAADWQVEEHAAQAAGEPAPGDKRPKGSDADVLRGKNAFAAPMTERPLPGATPGVAAHTGDAQDDADATAGGGIDDGTGGGAARGGRARGGATGGGSRS